MKQQNIIVIVLFSFIFLFQREINAENSMKPGGCMAVEDPVLKSITVDLLYWNDGVYMIDKSPLSCFDRYKDIFNQYNIPVVEIDITTGYQIPPLGDKYQPLWILVDSSLYLGDVDFYAIDKKGIVEKFPKGEQYLQLEKLTKVFFEKDILAQKNDLPVGRKGVMPAGWFDGTISAKKVRVRGMSIEDWKITPFYRLTFKKGKLISVQKIGKEKDPIQMKQQMRL